MNTKYIFIIMVIIFVGAIIGIGIYIFNKSDDNKTGICPPLNCLDAGDTIKNFYNSEGEWKNVFTMNPLKFNKINNNECDVLYNYNPVLGSSRTDSGEDKRRFTLSQDNSCKWNVQSMGTKMSGTSL